MAGVNKVILLGNLGGDPEVRTLENGVKVARLNLATSETYKDKNSGERVTQTEWHSVTLWRGLAEVAEKYLQKGSQIYVEGKIKNRKWTDKDGIDRYSIDIVGENMTMLSRPNDNQSERQNNSINTSTNTSDRQPTQSTSNNDAPDETDDLPF